MSNLQTQLVKKTAIIESGDFNLSAARYLEKVEINSDFKVVKLKDFTLFKGGFAFKSIDLSKDKFENYLPVIKIGNLSRDGILTFNNIQYYKMRDELSKFLIKKDDILIALTGATVGKVAISDRNNLLLNQRVGLIRSNNENLSNSYLKIMLLSEIFYDYCQRMAGGGAQGNISPKDVLNFSISLPPLEIQEQIVKEIEGYQQIIDGCRQVVNHYKPVIDIDPSWEKIPVKSLVKILSGYAFASKLFNDIKGTPIIRIRDIKKGFTKTFYKGDYDKKYLVEDGSLLVGMDGEFNIREWNGGNALLNQRVCKIYEYTGVYKKIFEVLMIKQLKKIENITQAVTVKHISIKQINKIELPVPSMEIQKEIVEKLEQERNIIEGNKELIKIYEKKINDKIKELF